MSVLDLIVVLGYGFEIGLGMLLSSDKSHKMTYHVKARCCSGCVRMTYFPVMQMLKKSSNSLLVTDLAKAQAGNAMRGFSQRIDLVNADIIHHVTLKPEE